MAFSFDNTVLDAALSTLSGNRTLHIVSGDPTSGSQVAGMSLANVALTASDFSAPGNHPTSGRQTVVAAKSGVSVTTTGIPQHYCILNGTTLLAKTEVAPGSPDLTQNSTVDIPAVVFSIAQPVAA